MACKDYEKNINNELANNSQTINYKQSREKNKIW